MAREIWWPENVKPNHLKAFIRRTLQGGGNKYQLARTWGTDIHTIDLWIRRFGLETEWAERMAQARRDGEACKDQEYWRHTGEYVDPDIIAFIQDQDPEWASPSPSGAYQLAGSGYTVIHEEDLYGCTFDSWIDAVVIPDPSKIMFVYSAVHTRPSDGIKEFNNE
jgi:hypothetical protein